MPSGHFSDSLGRVVPRSSLSRSCMNRPSGGLKGLTKRQRARRVGTICRGDDQRCETEHNGPCRAARLGAAFGRAISRYRPSGLLPVLLVDRRRPTRARPLHGPRQPGPVRPRCPRQGPRDRPHGRGLRLRPLAGGAALHRKQAAVLNPARSSIVRTAIRCPNGYIPLCHVSKSW